jgi:large subunit ribosomal protein L23
MKTLTIKPKVSEKAYAQSEQLNTYVFEVPAFATKQSVAQAVSKAYEVKVTAVRIAGVKGKTKRVYRRGARSVRSGHRPDIRKAYVTLKQGDKLPVFAAIEEGKAKPEEKR